MTLRKFRHKRFLDSFKIEPQHIFLELVGGTEEKNHSDYEWLGTNARFSITANKMVATNPEPKERAKSKVQGKVFPVTKDKADQVIGHIINQASRKSKELRNNFFISATTISMF